jgi:L-ribulokinase
MRPSPKCSCRLRYSAYEPDEARADAYDRLYAEYRNLHEHFGDGRMLHTLRAIRNEAHA